MKAFLPTPALPFPRFSAPTSLPRRPRISPPGPPRCALTPLPNGSVRVPTPFGFVVRQPAELPPMVSLAAETPRHPGFEARIEELRRGIAEAVARRNKRASEWKFDDRVTPTKNYGIESAVESLMGEDEKWDMATLRAAKEKNQSVLLALQELAFYPREIVAPVVVDILKNTSDELVRSQAIFTCAMLAGDSEDDECWNALKQYLFLDESPTVRSAAASAMGYMKEYPFVYETLIRSFYDDDNWLVQMCAASSLGLIGNPSAIPHLLSAIKKIDAASLNEVLLTQALIGTLADLGGGEEALNESLRFAQSKDAFVRAQLAEAMAKYKGDKVIECLNGLLNDSVEYVRKCAQKSLQQHGLSA